MTLRPGYQRTRTPIGQRRDRLRIQQATRTDDGMGGQTTTWAEVVSVWGAVVPIDARQMEATAAQQLQSRHAYHVDIAYRSDVAAQGAQMRLLWRDRTLEIHTADDDTARRRRLILLCGEVD
jgi:SPP1 family predicted phage head-tail adaptor